MSYDLYERSTQLSAPVEVYLWTASRWLANGTANPDIARYTSADRVVNFLSDNWFPVRVRRTNLHRGSGEPSATELVVTMPRRLDFVRDYFAAEGAPSAPVSLTIYRYQPGQSGYAIAFVGEAMYGTFIGNTIEVTCMTPEGKFSRKIPRLLNQPRCNWFLGDEGCGVNLTAYIYEGEITAITADPMGNFRVITVTGAEASKGGDGGHYTGGTLVAPNGERGFIEGNTGDDVVILQPMPVLEVGMTVSLLPGDDYTLKTCHDRFDNAGRFTGTTIKQPKINPHVSGVR